MNYVTLAVGEVLLLILTVCALAATFPRVRKNLTKFKKKKAKSICSDVRHASVEPQSYIVTLMLFVCLFVCSSQRFPKRLVAFSVWIDRTRWARNIWAMAAIFVLTMAVIADMV